jgi:biopolymer transport protein ExbD
MSKEFHLINKNMDEILRKEHKQKAGVKKSKKTLLRVDLTPMVDLGFLLISFFIFTTTLSNPTAMKLAIPDDNNIDSSAAPENKTLNILLSADNKMYVYNGKDINRIKDLGSNATSMRDAIFQKENEIRAKYESDSDMIVLIKPTPLSNYGNVVNALDEMLICNVKTYVLMDANAAEIKAIKE